MPQTTMAILAMALTALFSFTQQRNAVNSRLGMIKKDVELRATSVAVDLMEEIGSVSFDEAIKSGEVTNKNQLRQIGQSDNSLFRSSSSSSVVAEYDKFDSREASSLDDFNGKKMERVRVRDGVALEYDVFAEIVYVDEDGDVSNSQTKQKRAQIAVVSNTVAFADTMYLSHTFSCGSRCAW